MKTTRKHIAAFAALAAVAAFVTDASGQTTTWYYGASNNSANFGVTPTSSQAITWQDGWAGLSDNDGNHFGSASLAVARPDMDGLEEGSMVFGFGGTGLSAASVSNALLYLRSDFSAFGGNIGTPNTWTIMGLAAGNTNWDTSSMTWNDINGGSAGDWTGGTLGASLTGNYGTFNDLGTNVDGNLSIDITSAFQDYLNGTISGIAFANHTNGDTVASTDYIFVPFSNDNGTATNRPGLLVTTVPEPSAALLGTIGIAGLVLRRRRN